MDLIFRSILERTFRIKKGLYFKFIDWNITKRQWFL